MPLFDSSVNVATKLLIALLIRGNFGLVVVLSPVIEWPSVAITDFTKKPDAKNNSIINNIFLGIYI
jgi:hypothetical protein